MTMKHFTMFLGAVAMLFVFASMSTAGESGEAVFKKLACGSCHKMEKSSPINPSVAEIAKAYSGKKEQMVEYLNGNSAPIVKPEKESIMKGILRKTQALSDEDREALAGYLLAE
ncbi:cytochrome C552 [Oceanidesulfovibrio marinus]|uniref:Cytochrome C552 n=2 Tax=Oceanidesulfovibrio marinus TaxID=370038 RepID=A0A6P1ZE51_9BACT|nr:cytochrome C552 [Oceanidesulfovibrio marinus]